MNEIVKYNNYLNALKLKSFTTTDLNFLMTICAKMRDKDTEKVSFEFAEIKEIANYKITSTERFVEELKRMNKKLMEVTCELEFDRKILMFVLFPTFEIDLNKNILTVAVNERFKFILNALVRDFTRFELQEFVNLDSKYSKNLYRLLKQYRTTGVLKVTDLEDFKEKMDCPKAYKLKYFYEKVLKVALEELQEKEIFKNLICEPQHARKRGAPVVGYIFTFTPENQVKNIKRDEEKTSSIAAKKANKLENTERKYDYASLEAQLLQ